MTMKASSSIQSLFDSSSDLCEETFNGIVVSISESRSEGLICMGNTATSSNIIQTPQIQFQLSDYVDSHIQLQPGYEVEYNAKTDNTGSLSATQIKLTSKMKAIIQNSIQDSSYISYDLTESRSGYKDDNTTTTTLIKSFNKKMTLESSVNTPIGTSYSSSSKQWKSSTTATTTTSSTSLNSTNMSTNTSYTSTSAITTSSSMKDTLQSNQTSSETSSIDKYTIDPNEYTGGIKGTKANIQWRCIPMSDLRLHPLFHPLPDPASIKINSIRDVSLFRQESWQWDALHEGRLTTSKAAACLGMYEDRVGKVMNTPKSLLSHSRTLGAWSQLLHKPPIDWSFLEENNSSADRSDHVDSQVSSTSKDSNDRDTENVSTPPSSNKNQNHNNRNKNKKPNNLSKSPNIWIRNSKLLSNNNSTTIFPYLYQPIKKSNPTYSSSSSSSARLAWGSTQEATAVLAALNYYESLHQDTYLSEIGLLPSEAFTPEEVPLLSEWLSNPNLPLLGASPDGLIHHANETMEVLEVKCSSPFVEDYGPKKGKFHKGGQKGGTPRMTVMRRPPPAGVGAWHIPQLQLEILCAGPQCTGAVLITLSALDGAVLYRIPRNHEYIEHMLKLLKYFYTQYCLTKMTPPPNFSQLAPKELKYNLFYEKTVKMAQNAEVITKLKQDEIQRSPINKQFFL